MRFHFHVSPSIWKLEMGLLGDPSSPALILRHARSFAFRLHLWSVEEDLQHVAHRAEIDVLATSTLS